MTSKSRLKLIIAASVVILLGVLAGGWNAFQKRADTEWKMHRIELTEMPPNDDALIGWLNAQKDVSNASVERDQSFIAIRYEVLVNHPAPDLLNKIVSLGYKIRKRDPQEKKQSAKQT